jgi:hypothetical protein
MARRNEVDLAGIRERPAHGRVWFGAIALGLLAGAGLVAVAPWSAPRPTAFRATPRWRKNPTSRRWAKRIDARLRLQP